MDVDIFTLFMEFNWICKSHRQENKFVCVCARRGQSKISSDCIRQCIQQKRGVSTVLLFFCVTVYFLFALQDTDLNFAVLRSCNLVLASVCVCVVCLEMRGTAKNNQCLCLWYNFAVCHTIGYRPYIYAI